MGLWDKAQNLYTSSYHLGSPVSCHLDKHVCTVGIKERIGMARQSFGITGGNHITIIMAAVYLVKLQVVQRELDVFMRKSSRDHLIQRVLPMRKLRSHSEGGGKAGWTQTSLFSSRSIVPKCGQLTHPGF